MKIQDFFEQSWQRYIQITPDAPKVRELLEGKGEKVINDHVAYRTYNLPGIGKEEIGKIFEPWGYQKADELLEFPEKKLKAIYFLPPTEDLPKVFISELLLEKVPEDLSNWVRSFASSAGEKLKEKGPRFLLESNWDPIRKEDYERFYPVSEYAAWTAAFGIQLNHFTVFVNALEKIKTLQELNSLLKASGMELNQAGGEVKGTPEQLLEQSSTVARKVVCSFAGGERAEIMGCYYEFARRYLDSTGKYFHGFIPKSADKIFESNYEGKRK